MSVKDYTRESILGFLSWLEEERGNSAATRNYRLAAMKGFVHYLKYEFPDYMEEYQRILGIPIKKTEQKEISYMKTEGVELFVSQIDTNDTNGLRDYVMLLILYIYTLLLYMPGCKNGSAGIEQLMPWSDFIKEHCSGLIDVENITVEEHPVLTV